MGGDWGALEGVLEGARMYWEPLEGTGRGLECTGRGLGSAEV